MHGWARREAGSTSPESSELGAATFELRNQSIQVLEDIVRRGLERGVFRIAHVWLAVAAIGAMGIRVAYGYTPEFELDAQQVADIYAQFCACSEWLSRPIRRRRDGPASAPPRSAPERRRYAGQRGLSGNRRARGLRPVTARSGDAVHPEQNHAAGDPIDEPEPHGYEYQHAESERHAKPGENRPHEKQEGRA